MIGELRLAETLDTHILLAVDVFKSVRTASYKAVIYTGVQPVYGLFSLFDVYAESIGVKLLANGHSRDLSAHTDNAAPEFKLMEVVEEGVDGELLHYSGVIGIACIVVVSSGDKAYAVVEVLLGQLGKFAVQLFEPRQMIAFLVELFPRQIGKIRAKVNVIAEIAVKLCGELLRKKLVQHRERALGDAGDTQRNILRLGDPLQFAEKTAYIALAGREGEAWLAGGTEVLQEVKSAVETYFGIGEPSPREIVGKAVLTALKIGLSQRGVDAVPVRERNFSEFKHLRSPSAVLLFEAVEVLADFIHSAAGHLTLRTFALGNT